MWFGAGLYPEKIDFHSSFATYLSCLYTFLDLLLLFVMRRRENVGRLTEKPLDSRIGFSWTLVSVDFVVHFHGVWAGWAMVTRGYWPGWNLLLGLRQCYEWDIIFSTYMYLIPWWTYGSSGHPQNDTGDDPSWISLASLYAA